jgi:hypothetical protein
MEGFTGTYGIARAQVHPAGDSPYIDTLNRSVVPLIGFAIVDAVLALFVEIFER